MLIDDNTDGLLMGLFGTTTVNVLQLNLALDAATQ
jgi:K+-transporting ATPase c subunit